MGMAGAPFPLLHRLSASRGSAFGLAYAVNSIADADDRRHHELGRPADRRAAARYRAAVHHRDHLVGRSTLLIVGVMLVVFVIGAPKGIVGLVQDLMRAGAKADGTPTWRSRLAISPACGGGAR